ncbi:MAG: hypothetical protein C0483_07870 [Pirellula sp.]|nr:hypothetical protein [Pirellula sp.]
MASDAVMEVRAGDQRVLLLPPTTRDAEAVCQVLANHGIVCAVYPTMESLCDELRRHGGVAMVSEEAITGDASFLIEVVATQPVWSDLPIIVLSRSGKERPSLERALAQLGNVSVLERPVRVTTLVSVVRSALRARERQYQVRDHLAGRESAETALRESREQLEIVVHGANVGVWFCPLPFDVLNWDATVKAHFHLPADAPITIDTFYERLHPEDRERTRAAIAESISRREPYDIDYRTVSPDGRNTHWIRASGRAVADAAGEVVRFDGITIDVTERVRVQEELRAGEERLRLAVETGRLGVWEMDLSTRHMTSSPICKANFGRSPDDLFSYEDLWASVHPDDVRRVRDAVQGSIEQNAEYDTEYRNIWPDGSTHWVLARGRASYDALGTPQRMIGVTLDITDRKHDEDRRSALLEAERSARSSAERAGRMKDEFLATLSHELRTPLNAILGWSQILKMTGTDSAEAAEGVDVIERNARAQAQIIEDLLDMSRIISGKIELDVQHVDLAAVVRSSVHTMQPAADAKEIHIETKLDARATSILADTNRLQQVFWNLLSNAVKFTSRGGLVRVALQRVDSHIEIRVIDSGEGIDPAFLPHVFDRFRQADATTTRRHGGLGLGLAIVKQLVELHGGSIRAESAGLGKGSTFVVSLPLSAVQTAPSPTPERRRSGDAAKLTVPKSESRFVGLKILVVDDEADARALLRRLLEGCGAIVFVASTVDDALELIAQEQPDVIISDIGMPGEDGYSLIRRVRALPADRGGGIPAVALTAYARSEDRISAIVAGFTHHLAKPVEPAELIAVVSSIGGRVAAS